MKRQIESRKQLLWGIIAIVLGLVIAINSEAVISFSIKLIGIALAVVGGVEIASTIVKNKKNPQPAGFALFGAIVATIIGIVIFINPGMLVGLFMVLLGTGVILLAIMQIITLMNSRKAGANFSGTFYVFPILLALSGVMMMLFPISTSSWIVTFAGIWIMAFGVAEIIGKICIRIPEAKIEQ